MLRPARAALRELYLEGLRLSRFPEAITELCCLEVLSFYANAICDLPDGPYLANLQALDVGNNSLEEIPTALASCKKLRLLFLDDNALLLLHTKCLGSATIPLQSHDFAHSSLSEEKRWLPQLLLH